MCALIHSGYINNLELSQAHRISNRRLEFLGDSLLNMAVASFLFQSHASYSEGQLTVTKANLVSNRVLAKICHDLHLHQYLLVSDEHERILRESDYDGLDMGIKASLRKGIETIQAGSVESLIAAIYLDKGLASTLEFVNEKIIPRALCLAKKGSEGNPITDLQHLLQEHKIPHPMYRFVASVIDLVLRLLSAGLQAPTGSINQQDLHGRSFD